MTKEQAYDAARREFYVLRHQEDVERRVAQEEARMMGAYFGRSALDVGMQFENWHYGQWRLWARRLTKEAEALQMAGQESFVNEPSSEVAVEE